MRAVGIEVTRDGYIRAAYGDNDIPKSWTPEHEMELPEELQDWTLFPPELRPLEPPDDAEAEEAQSGPAPTESGAPTPSVEYARIIKGHEASPEFPSCVCRGGQDDRDYWREAIEAADPCV